MADHARTQIRDAATTLVTGLTTTGANAFAGRSETRPLQSGELPGLLLYTHETKSEPLSGTMGARRFGHGCDLVIEGYATGTGDIDKMLDTIEKEVRTALEAAPTLSGKCKDLWCANVVKETAPEAEKPIWRIRMTWQCDYDTREGVPDAALA